MKKIITLLLVVVILLSLAACGQKNQSTESEKSTTEENQTAEMKTAENEAQGEVSTVTKNYKIGVSIMELTAYTWFQGVIDGCNKWQAENGEANGVNMEFTFEDSQSDVQKMLTNIENMVASGSNGIILFPADASSAIPLMKQYTAEGVPFIIGDYKQEVSSESDKVWSTFVGHDMKALGKKAGEVAVDYLKTLGKDDPTCLFITVPTSGQVSKDRFDGFSETVLAAFPNANIIEEGDTNGNSRDSSQTLMENVLQREKNIDVVCGHNDSAVVGAYNAAVAEGRKEIRFIGIAGDIDVLTWLSEGNEQWLAEVLQDPTILGYQATDAIYRVLAKGEKLPENYDLPEPEAITQQNISQYDWKNWNWLG